MGRLRLLKPCLLLALLTLPAHAQILSSMRTGDWPEATALAAADPDPVATQLVAFLRILNAVDGSARPSGADIARFIGAHRAWPEQALLQRRLAEAIVDEPDLREVGSVCAANAHTAPLALARCAEAQGWAGAADKAAASARAAWAGGLVQGEEDFLARWDGVIPQEEQWERFRALVGIEDAARRQLARLDPTHRAAAAAWLAFRHDDAGALAALAGVAPTFRNDPLLLLEEARSQRRTGAIAAALSLWQGAGFDAEARSPPEARASFWAERDVLARKFLAQGDAAAALRLADDVALNPPQAADARFLAGWILLRRLHDPARASAQFAALATSSHAAITLSRAQYWLARAASDQGLAAQAASFYGLAAAWPTTFYGQQALAALHQDAAARIAALDDPPSGAGREGILAATDLWRAAAKLAAWGDARRARAFVLRLAQSASTPQDLALLAGLALKLGLPETAVAVARLAGHEGVVLPQRGWPAPFQPPAGVDPDLALGLMRQESSFDPQAVSAAGAQGLMQLMPLTARQLSAEAGNEGPPDLRDPDTNMRLGTAYLDQLLGQFGGVVPYALAAYNAGGRRVRAWMASNGDIAGADRETTLDWIELIPFAETRNYVQRVMESAAVYAARRDLDR